MKIKAHGKINLSLDIKGKLPDGYHELEMIMQEIDLNDELDINIIEEGIEIKCDKKYIPTDKRNTVYKAIELVLSKYNIKKGVSVNIIKNIPSQAGLGGGSSDAAGVIMGLNKLFSLNLKIEDLISLGKEIGADVPFFMVGGTALCKGIGEKIEKIKSFKGRTILLVKPYFGVSTKLAYDLFDLEKEIKEIETPKIIKYIEEGMDEKVVSLMGNVLEDVIVKKYNEILRIKNNLIQNGAIGSMMTGSGSTVFSIFNDEEKAKIAYEKMKMKYKDVFLTKTI